MAVHASIAGQAVKLVEAKSVAGLLMVGTLSGVLLGRYGGKIHELSNAAHQRRRDLDAE